MIQFGEWVSPHNPWRIKVSGIDRPAWIFHQSGQREAQFMAPHWAAKSGWFAFVENEDQCWLYDGDLSLFLLQFRQDQFKGYAPNAYPCRVPAQVLNRVSTRMRQTIRRLEPPP